MPPGDVVIKYPQGAFLIVKCDEDLARKLYWHPERCNYDCSLQTYRFVSLFGTLLLMIGVISLSNAQTPQQIGFAASYMILHAAYWFVAALPARKHWNLRSLDPVEEKIAGGMDGANFTEALWKAIAVTRSTDWVKIGNIAPRTTWWDSWLKEAKEVVDAEDEKVDPVEGIVLPDWNCQEALSKYIDPDKAAANV